METNADDNANAKFVETFELLVKSIMDQKEYESHKSTLFTLLKDNEVSYLVVLKTFSAYLQQHPEYASALGLFMAEIVESNRIMGKYKYPEFFWLLLEYENAFQKIDIAMFAQLLRRLSNKDLVRTYLLYRLIKEENINILKNIIFSFFNTGHTVESLKAVEAVIHLLPKVDEKIYLYMYKDTWANLFPAGLERLDKQDKDYLRKFFEKGLSLNIDELNSICSQAVELLQI